MPFTIGVRLVTHCHNHFEIEIVVSGKADSVINAQSFSLEKGDYLCVLGENGSGKTTLMRIILGLTEATSGEIIYSNMSKNEIGYLPQLSGIQPDFPASVQETVMSGFFR